MIKNVKQIVNLLKKKKITLSTAESCTGGMIAQTITSISGASSVFKFGLITYSNQSKIKYLKTIARINGIIKNDKMKSSQKKINNKYEIFDDIQKFSAGNLNY